MKTYVIVCVLILLATALQAGSNRWDQFSWDQGVWAGDNPKAQPAVTKLLLEN